MAKVRNIGTTNYIGTRIEIRAGEIAEVSDETAAYLCSAECPGDFQIVEEAYIEKGKKGRRAAE